MKQSQLWLTLLGLALLMSLLYSKRADLGAAWEALRTAKLRYVLLLPVLQATSFFFVGKYYQSMLALFKAKISSMRAWGVVAALTFVNQILPSGGASGLAYLVYGFRNLLSAGKVGLIQLARYILSMSVYILFTPLVIVLVYISGEGEWLADTVSRASKSPEAVSFVVGFALILVVTAIVVRSRDKTHHYANKFEAGFNRVVNVFRRKKKDTIKKGTIAGVAHDFHDGLDFLKEQRLKVMKPFGFMVLSTIVELSIVYTAFQAVGGEISIGVLFVAFIGANIAGVVSIIPGDIGVHESVMILMLSTLGIPDSIAISATLLYRVFNKMIFMPVGFYFYSRLLKPMEDGKVA